MHRLNVLFFQFCYPLAPPEANLKNRWDFLVGTMGLQVGADPGCIHVSDNPDMPMMILFKNNFYINLLNISETSLSVVRYLEEAIGIFQGDAYGQFPGNDRLRVTRR